MSALAELLPKPRALLDLSWGHGRFALGSGIVLWGLESVGWWATLPNFSLSLALGVGAALVRPERWWAAPLVLSAALLPGLMVSAIGIPAVVGAGLGAGAAAAIMAPPAHRATLQGALAGSAAASLAMWALYTLFPVLPAALIGLVVGGGAALSLYPSAFHRTELSLPSAREVRKLLKGPYQPRVFAAFSLFRSAAERTQDETTRSGLQEVAQWVLRLQLSLQTLDDAIREIDPAAIRSRIQSFASEISDDPFTAERRKATVQHLRRLLEHHDAMRAERGRITALVDFALAYLEESRAGLVVALTLPGEFAPERLHEVLTRLRDSAQAGRLRRESAREINSVTGDG